MHRLTAIISGIILLIVLGLVGLQEIQYERNVGGHLKLAADANNTERAEQQLRIAVEGMEAWGFCNGGGDSCFTSVIFRTPEDDVGYWRENIEATLADLHSMSDEERADNLIESNQLIKVRETLMDAGQNGDAVTAPKGISRYPNNGGFAIWVVASIMGLLIGWFVWERGGQSRGW